MIVTRTLAVTTALIVTAALFAIGSAHAAVPPITAVIGAVSF